MDGTAVPVDERYRSNSKMMMFKCMGCSHEPPHVTIHTLAAVIRFPKTLECRFCNNMCKSSYEETAWEGMVLDPSKPFAAWEGSIDYAAEVRVVKGWSGAVDLYDWGASLIVQIDGEQHMKANVCARDQQFNEMAAQQGHNVLRILCTDLMRLDHWVGEAYKLARAHPGQVFILHSSGYGHVENPGMRNTQPKAGIDEHTLYAGGTPVVPVMYSRPHAP